MEDHGVQGVSKILYAARGAAIVRHILGMVPVVHGVADGPDVQRVHLWGFIPLARLCVWGSADTLERNTLGRRALAL